MGGTSLDRELLNEALDGMYNNKVPTASAFTQRRGSVLPKAFEDIYRKHAQSLSTPVTWHGRRIFAHDGSDLVYMEDRTDAECHFEGYNKLHINALYDLCNNVYIDASVDHGREEDEREAAAEMAARFPKAGGPRPIAAMDRGYEAYNLMACLEEAGWDYLIRVKDIDSTGIFYGLRWTLEDNNAFDKDIRLIITRKQTKEVKAHPEIYKILPSNSRFDLLEGRETYEIKFRAVKFKLPNGTWECLITNLPREEFPPETLMELYWKRWGIETSFRLLKNALCLKNVHAKKREYIKQEVFAKLTIPGPASAGPYLV
jgi:IS4 transposase